MLRFFLFSFFLLVGIVSHSQNLVPNPSFENYSSCPQGQGQINRATPWYSTRGTVDYYNSCSGNVGFQVPSNGAGNQNARTGQAYAGFFCRQGLFEVREYLSVQLTSPLIAGEEYCVSFYVSLADDPNDYDLAVNDIGAFFTDSFIAPNANNFNHLALTPQVVNSGQILDNRVGWQQISGSFVATGGEIYLIIGSFIDNNNQNITPLGPNGGWNEFSYYFVDDVSVVQCSSSMPLTVSISGNALLCEGDEVTLIANVQGGTPNYSYSWNGQNGGDAITFNAQNDTTISVVVTDFNGVSATDSIVVVVTLSPLVDAGPDLMVCPGQFVTLTATGATTYLWNSQLSDVLFSGVFYSDTIIYLSGETMSCLSTDTITISVLSDCNDEVQITNVFSPNGDGLNDFFLVIADNIDFHSIVIRNRWGLVVFETSAEFSWNGLHYKSGQPCSSGTYFYEIKLGKGESTKIFTGHVTLFY
ncbi:MAG: gliding motility-associated C-terminal domain-containing protein [Flavobacteriales bacterium]